MTSEREEMKPKATTKEGGTPEGADKDPAAGRRIKLPPDKEKEKEKEKG